MARRNDPQTEVLADAVEAAPQAVPFAEAAAEPAIPAVADMPPSRRRGLFGPVLGGALAALGGFGLSHFNAFGLTVPDNTSAIAALSGRLDTLDSALAADSSQLPALRDDLAGLRARLDALEAAPELPDLSAIETLDQRLAAIEALPQGGGASTAALATKLADLERRLAARPAGGVDTARVDAAIARLEAAEAEARARADVAAKLAAEIERAAALDRLRAAVAAGASFDAELAALSDPALTTALGPHVAGVATPEALQAGFPDLARQALAIARAAGGELGWGTRLVDFLASQTGARALSPRKGDTPDAILSRADFALSEGRISDALTELAALAPEVRAPFEAWITQAEARLAVVAALEAA